MAQYTGMYIRATTYKLMFQRLADSRDLATSPCKHWLITLTLTRRSICVSTCLGRVLADKWIRYVANPGTLNAPSLGHSQLLASSSPASAQVPVRSCGRRPALQAALKQTHIQHARAPPACGRGNHRGATSGPREKTRSEQEQRMQFGPGPHQT